MHIVDSRYDHPCKAYVGVDTHTTAEGVTMPKAVYWKDGRHFEIDEILDVRKAASLKAGGCGIRYTVRIGNQRRYLFWEEERWFVET